MSLQLEYSSVYWERLPAKAGSRFLSVRFFTADRQANKQTNRQTPNKALWTLLESPPHFMGIPPRRE